MLSASTCFRLKRQAGFSLIELLIGVAILGILVASAVPNYRIWILNSQIRNAAESIQNGMLRARGEAIGRGNVNVEFVLLNGPGQTSWQVRIPSLANLVVDSRTSSEGSPNVTRAANPAGATTVTFDNTGGTAPNADGSPSVLGLVLDLDVAVLEAAKTQELAVTVGFGGKVRMCDPNLSSPNPRAC